MAKKEDFAVWDLDDDEVDDIIDDDDDADRKPRRPEKGDRSPEKRIGKQSLERKKGSKPRGPQKKKKGIFGNAFFVWSMRIIVVIAVLMLLFLPLQPLEQFREDAGINKLRNLLRPFREFPEWVEANMTVKYDLTITAGTADEARIKTAIPFDIQDEDGSFRIQNVTSVKMLPEPYTELPDYNKQMNIISGWKKVDERGNFQFKAQFSVKLYSYQWDINEDDSGTIDDIPNDLTDKYLDDEWIVEDTEGKMIDNDMDGVPDYYRYHPSVEPVRLAAERITESEMTVYGKVKAIYEWIEDHFNYTTNDQRARDQAIYGSWPKYPLATLEDWYGDCDDQSLLMASMCRAVGIPAWLEIGYLYDPMAKSWGGHGWFNVVIPLKGQGHIVAPIDPVNHEFLFRDPFRITDWIDTGGDLPDPDDGGNPIFNLDYYYNYFKVTKNNFVDVDVRMSTEAVQFEDHGSIRQYVDEKMKPGNLPGSQEGFDKLPFPTALIAAAAALPIILGRKRLE